MRKILVLAAALLALPAPSEAAQARRMVDDVVDALKRLRRGERVPLPRAEVFEHKLLRGADGRFRSWHDVMRPGAIDESLPPFRRLIETNRLDDSLKAVIRSDPQESARLLTKYGDDGADLLGKIGKEGMALNRHLDDELAETVRAVEKGSAGLRAAGHAVEEVDHAKGLVNVGKKMGKAGLRFVRENWQALALAGVLTTLYLNPEILQGPVEDVARGARGAAEALVRGIFYDRDGTPSVFAFSMAGLAGLGLLSWLASIVYPWFLARRLNRLSTTTAPPAAGPGKAGLFLLLGLAVGGASLIPLWNRGVSRLEKTAAEGAAVERLTAAQAAADRAAADEESGAAERLLQEAGGIRLEARDVLERSAAEEIALRQEGDAALEEAELFRRREIERRAQLRAARERLACVEEAEKSLAGNKGKPDLSDTKVLIRGFEDLERRGAAQPRVVKVEP